MFLPFLKKIYALIRVITIGSQIKGISSISYKRCEGAIKTFGLKVINPNNLLHNVDITPNPKKATKGLNITRNENGRNVATDTEDINYDNIYLRLSLLGVQQVANGENFIKFNIE